MEVKLIFPELGYFLLEEIRMSGMESALHQCNLEQVTLGKSTHSRFQALHMNTNFLIPVFKRWLVGDIPIIKIVQIVRMVNFIFFDHQIKKS